MHGLHKMFYFERKKTVTKCSTLSITDVVNCPQYMSTWIAYTNNLIQEPDKRYITIVTSIYGHYIWFFKVQYKSRKTQSISGVEYELTTK